MKYVFNTVRGEIEINGHNLKYKEPFLYVVDELGKRIGAVVANEVLSAAVNGPTDTEVRAKLVDMAVSDIFQGILIEKLEYYIDHHKDWLKTAKKKAEFRRLLIVRMYEEIISAMNGEKYAD